MTTSLAGSRLFMLNGYDCFRSSRWCAASVSQFSGLIFSAPLYDSRRELIQSAVPSSDRPDHASNVGQLNRSGYVSLSGAELTSDVCSPTPSIALGVDGKICVIRHTRWQK